MSPSHPVYQSHAEIEREIPKWLWPGRIPRGKLTILGGDPGTGKSFITLSLASILSRGGAWPTGEPSEPAGVIVISDEDDVADTIGPRLDVMDARADRIFQFYGVQYEGRDHLSHFSFGKDLPSLEETITRTKAGLVIIDPISAYLGYIDSFKEAEVRECLTPLAKLASKVECAVVGVAHMNKNQEAKAVYRMTGSIAFTALARAAFLVAKDSEDPERRVMMPVKFNLGPEPKAIAYRLEDVTHPLGFTTAKLVWEGETEDRVEDLIGAMEDTDRRGAVSSAETFLKEIFQGTEGLPERTIQQEAKQARVSMTALNRAKRALHLKSVKKGVMWWWERNGQAPEGGEP